MASKQAKKVTDGYPFYQKLDSNCPDAEKTGSGPGSCGGGADKHEGKVSELKAKIDAKLKELDSSKGPLQSAALRREINNLKYQHQSLVAKEGKGNGNTPADAATSAKSDYIDHHEQVLKKEVQPGGKTVYTREDASRSASVVKSEKYKGAYDTVLDTGHVHEGRSQGNAHTIAKNYAAFGQIERPTKAARW